MYADKVGYAYSISIVYLVCCITKLIIHFTPRFQMQYERGPAVQTSP